MSLTWTPLEVPAGATPEEAFAAGAVHSHDSKIILLAWVKGVGWMGCRARNFPRSHDPSAPAELLLRVDDCLICAVERGSTVIKTNLGDDNAKP